MKISLVSLGQTGAGPVYSLEMAKALASNNRCELQIIISSNVTNLKAWNEAFKNSRVDYHVIESYKHTKTSVILSCINLAKQERLVRIIKQFKPDVLYIPFGLMWARYVYLRLHKHIRIISTLHDIEFHDSLHNLSIAELGSYLLTYGSQKYVDAYVILNKKDVDKVWKKTGKDICVIPHASFDYYFKDNRDKVNSIKKCIGFFGRIEVYKGLDLLVEAFEKSKTENLSLLIAGSGTVDNQLLQRINNNPRIHLINRYIEDNEFQDLLDQVDFCVLPYKRASQSGVIPMSFAAGKAVVATNVGALSEQVPDGTGIITTVDSSRIADTIDWLYTTDDKILEYGANAKHYAQTELSWNKSAEWLIDFAQKICSVKKD